VAALSQKARIAILGVIGSVAAFFVFGGLRGGGAKEPIDAVPKDSFLVATLDAAELRRSPIYDVLFGKDAPGTSSALGIGALAEACGFDPLSRVSKLAVAVPEQGDRGELGLAAKVEVTRDELERCTKSLAGKRGGKAETREVGGFVVLEDGAPSHEKGSRLAYGAGGLLLVGKGAWLDAMIGAAEQKAPALRDAELHTRLRASLTGRDGWRAPTLVVTALLPRSLRDRIKDEMGAEIGASDPSSNTMGAVLGVSAVGVALKTGTSGGLVEATVELECDSADACAIVDKLIQKKRLDWSRDLALRMVGFGPLVDSLETKPEGARLRATASANVDTLSGAIERAMKLRARSAPPAKGPAPPQRDPATRPDERVTAKDADARDGGARTDGAAPR
jgi:hypothetical protein